MSAYSQQVSQNISGKITDAVSRQPLVGASVSVTGTEGEFQATTDEEGKFLMTIPTGRYKLAITFVGYSSIEDELLVVAGKSNAVNTALTQSESVLQEVEINSIQSEDVPGLRSVTIEKTMRVPANFFDPVRMATSYPGVVASSDQNNSIIVRGNSPNGLLWRLNGVDIVNPNHLANAGTLSDMPAANGGGVNILSAQMLDRTDFYMGALPTNYGNALAGVIDMKLRDGNKSDFEFTGQASLIGLDMAAEGPIGKGDKNSFLANYRYSTVGLLSAAGVNFGDEAISFQDFSAHASFEQENGGNLSLFGLWGDSKNEFNAKDPSEIKEDKDRKDIDYEARTYAVGLNYNFPVKNGSVIFAAAYSNGFQSRNSLTNWTILPVQLRKTNEAYDNTNGLLSASLNLKKRIAEKTDLSLGLMANLVDYEVNHEITSVCFDCQPSVTDLSGVVEGILLQPYINAVFRITPKLKAGTGVRYVYFQYNGSSSVEPRVQADYLLTSKSSLQLSYGLTSQTQQITTYVIEGNKDLELTKSHHADIHYKQSLVKDLTLNTGVFYQYLYDVPVTTSGDFSAINMLEGFAPQNLTNEGTGSNYGVEATVEKLFYNKSYLLVGACWYNAVYGSGNDETRFNGNYTANAIYGKDWTKSSKNRTISLSSRVLYLGGLREFQISPESSEQTGETVAASERYDVKLPDYFRIDLRVSFRKNKPGYTRTFAIDIQNFTNQQNVGYHYYDQTQQKIVTKYQLGIIPVLVYRIDF